MKRQRTSSRSISPAPELEPESQPPANDDSDDELNTRNGSKKARNGRTQRDLREKEEKEEKERVRQEAANKRKGRAERRRAEGNTCGKRSKTQLTVANRLRTVRRNPRGSVQTSHCHERRASPHSRTCCTRTISTRNAAKHHHDRRKQSQEGQEQPQKEQGQKPVYQRPGRRRRVACPIHVS